MSAPFNKKNILRDVFASLAIAAILVIGYFAYQQSLEANDYLDNNEEGLKDVEYDRKYKFGFDTEEHHFETATLEYNQFVGQILNDNGISYSKIAKLEEKAKDVFDVRNIRAGKRYHIVKKDSCLLYTSPSPRDRQKSRMPSSA